MLNFTKNETPQTAETNTESTADKFKLVFKILHVSLVIFLLLTVAVLSVLLYNAENTAEPAGSIVSTVDPPRYETIKRYAREPFVLANYEPLFNDDINKKVLFYDSTLGEVYVPLLTDVPLNQFDNQNYHNANNGLKYYIENGEVKNLAGIDVSAHNGDIDWHRVKAFGIDFAIVRVGFRGYESGAAKLDPNYEKNISGAIAAGIKVGVYFFSQALTIDEALEESNMVLDAINGYDISFPVIYDWEVIYDDNARTDEMKVEDFTDTAIAFCENIKNNGYVPMVYGSRKLCYLKYDMSRLKYDFWLADYNPETSYYYSYQIWQYSSTGKVDGISGDVDLNLSFVDYSGEINRTVDVASVFEFDSDGKVIDAVTTTATT